MTAAAATRCRLLAFIVWSVVFVQAQPSNNLCTNATDVTTFPYVESGTNLIDATNDAVLSSCGSGDGGSGWEAVFHAASSQVSLYVIQDFF